MKTKGAVFGKLAFIIASLCTARFNALHLIAGGVVTNCTDADLRVAIAGGGTVAFGCDGVIVLTNTITISKATEIDATGHWIVISGSNSVQIFIVQADTTLRGLVLADGVVAGADATEPESNGNSAYGGAIWNQAARLVAVDCSFVRNQARGGQGGLNAGNRAPGPGGAGQGGAIFNYGGSLRLTNVSFLENAARGGLAGSYSGSGAPQLGGSGGSAQGGALWQINGDIIATNVLFTANAAISGQPQMSNGYSGHVWGGAGYFATTRVSFANCRFASNWCGGGIRGGSAQGGAISTIGPLGLTGIAMTNSIWIGNRAIGGAPYGGAVSDAAGGAVCGGQASFDGCAFIGNEAQGGSDGNAPTAGAARGGAIAAIAYMRNVTLFGNVARGGSGRGNPGSAYGGAIFGGGVLVHVTVVGNLVECGVGGNPLAQSVSQGGGVYYFAASGSFEINNCIFAYNRSDNFFGEIYDDGGNISSDSTPTFTAFSSHNRKDPQIGALGEYGGPTPTIPLLAGSPAIDAAQSFFSTLWDQRGVARPQGNACDIGAFEATRLILSVLPGGNCSLEQAGVPNASCTLMRSRDMLKWTPVETRTANASGHVSFMVPAEDDLRFFRTVTP